MHACVQRTCNARELTTSFVTPTTQLTISWTLMFELFTPTAIEGHPTFGPLGVLLAITLFAVQLYFMARYYLCATTLHSRSQVHASCSLLHATRPPAPRPAPARPQTHTHAHTHTTATHLRRSRWPRCLA